MSPKAKRRIFTSAIVLLVLIGLLWWTRSGPSELDLYKAQLIAQGEILDLDQLAPKRTGKEPDGDQPLLDLARKNQLIHLTLSTGNLELRPDTNGIWHVHWTNHTNALTQAERAALWIQAASNLDARHQYFPDVHQALENPPAEKGADYRDHAKYPKALAAHRLHLSRSLHTAVVVAAHDGGKNGAARQLTALLNLAEWHRNEWMLHDQSIRRRICQSAGLATAYAVQSRLWDEATLQQFQTRWENLSLLTNWFQPLLYDRTTVMDVFNRIRADPNSMGHINFSNKNKTFADRCWETYWFRFGRDEDELMFLKQRQADIDIWRNMLQSPHWSSGIMALKTMDDEWGFMSADNIKARRYRVTYMASANITQGVIAQVLTETLRQQTIAALALERYRLVHGQYPDTLAILVPEYLKQLPQDPWDGRPLRYRLNPDTTITLWSVGIDGKDDGGNSSRRIQSPIYFPDDTRDLVWPRIDPLDLPPK